ncbi:MAG: hypothetical protein JNL83_22845 [Myxococcales bacterium]|nr:hypothetical protein [Myxococcales bacterium]
MRRLVLLPLLAAMLARPAYSDSTPAAGGHDFTPTGKVLLTIGACGGGEVPAQFNKQQVKQHCAIVDKTQAEYRMAWVDRARPWFAAHVPANVPKKVVYPFAGGDLSTALTVFPDADEITTMSLEPAGDPRTLEALAKLKSPPAPVGKKDAVPAPAAPAKPAKSKAVGNAPPERADDGNYDTDPVIQAKGPPSLAKALRTIEYELRFLYRVNFSNTLNMIDAMRGGLLPTQLIFGLSALDVHGYEVVALRYFKLDADGNIKYLTADDVAKAPDPTSGSPDFRNRIFANAEIQFRKPGGRIQVYRHLQVNLDNDHLKKDPRVLKHLEQKGDVAGMTKAASYLLSWDSFSTIRNYLIDHVQWMVSDATGVPPKYGKAKGFEYETYGAFQIPHIGAGNQIAKDWRTEFAAQPQRKLGFRFGYYDGTKEHTNHLAIMRKPGLK